jgi:hypothetical protein
MNEEKFSKCFVCNSVTTESKQYSSHFFSARKLNENNYQVKMENSTYGCRTPLTQGFFTLGSAKFWYLNFIYNFMFKCLDITRLHFVEDDSDSMYWAVSGCKTEDYQQGFKFVIKNHKLYNDNIYKYAPGFYTSNFSNSTFKSKIYSCSNTEVVKIVESEFEKKNLFYLTYPYWKIKTERPLQNAKDIIKRKNIFL